MVGQRPGLRKPRPRRAVSRRAESWHGPGPPDGRSRHEHCDAARLCLEHAAERHRRRHAAGARLPRHELLRHRPQPPGPVAALPAGRAARAHAAALPAAWRNRRRAARRTGPASPTGTGLSCIRGDAFGRDEDWIEFHPAYREMEQIGFGDFGIHAMSRRPGVLGWNGTPITAKYILQYLFVQSEFALMCPISVTDTSAYLIGKYGDAAVRERFMPGLTSQDMGEICKAARVYDGEDGRLRCGRHRARRPAGGGARRPGMAALRRQRWFCSCADADVALLLARPEGAAPGTAGLGLFALPKRRDDGSRNSYRIVRLKDKMGARSMASGEILFDGAVAYPLGKVGPGRNNGLKQMLDQVNLSRLSHGVRAAAMMRRCLNEALVAARGRAAFGSAVADKPLMRRQLLKLMAPTEQALSMALFTADRLERSEAGDERAAALDAAADAAAEIPHLPRQYRGRDRRDGGARRQWLYRDLRQRPAGARRASRRGCGRAPPTSMPWTLSAALSARARRACRARRDAGGPAGGGGRPARPVEGGARPRRRPGRRARRGGRRGRGRAAYAPGFRCALPCGERRRHGA